MLPFSWYMLKVIICSGILFGYYWLFLRNKIFHRYNRFYLLAAMLLSLLLPLFKINFWQPATDTSQAIRVLQAVSAGDEYMNNIVLTARRNSWSLEQLYPVIYILVSLVFLFVMLRTLLLIRTLLKNYPVQRVEDVAFVNTEDDSTPFSFLKYIFWNRNIDLETTTGRQIFKHEVAHIQEKHSHDKLFVNIILIFCWCNPFFWLYRKELNMIHEFIADKKAVEDSDTSAFAAMILQAAYPKHRFELTNNFFYSPIKRRLMMLTKKQNRIADYINQWLAILLLALVFLIFSCKANKKDLIIKPETSTNKTLIDTIKIKEQAIEESVNHKNLAENSNDNKVFTIAEVEPKFTGGQDAWKKYLRENVKALTPVDEGWKAGIYIVVVKFIVHTDGTVSDVTTEDYVGTKTALHCIEVIKNAPKWQPAVQNGRKVNAYKKQPITFVIEE